MSRPSLSKVPEITALFWVVKILTTGMGETTSDYLGHLNLVLAGGLSIVLFVAAFVAQYRADRYVPQVYWFTVVMVSVVGTMFADVVHLAGIPYWGSSSFYALVLAGILFAWYRSEGTLSIHSVRTRRRETFYWATVLATFALGTAVGDLTATVWHLGYLKSGLLFAAVIAVPYVAWRWFGLGEVAAFWAAYIVTRPLGASFADWMGVPVHRHGLGWGTGPVSLVLGILIAFLVGAIAFRYTATGRAMAVEAEY
jgi:uncharacterized membrane-anchored protein